MWGHGPYGMFADGWSSMGWMMIFGGIFWIILIVLGVMVVVWIVRSPSSDAMRAHALSERGSSALSILEERYARGEIKREEYLEKKRDLGA